MAPKSFMECPLELRLSILDYLSFDDVLPLTLVSKDFHSLAEPRLYSDIHLSWTRDHVPPLVPLLRTIVRKPGLGQAVRSLRLDGAGFNTSFTQFKNGPPALPTSALPDSAAEHIRSIGIPQAENWAKELQDGSVDALVALLVYYMPHIVSLHLGPNFTIRNFRLGEIFRCALKTDGREDSSHLPKFRSLSHVVFPPRIHESYHRAVNNAADVLPFFYLPAIETLSVSVDNPGNWPSLLTSSHVTTLELFRLRETGLGRLLGPLTSLRKLHWHCYYQGDLDTHSSKSFVDLDITVEALRRTEDTLEDLFIEADTHPAILHGEYEPPGLDIQGSLRGLETFAFIRNLRLPWTFLLGPSPETAAERAMSMVDFLPRNLEMLHLTSDLMDHEQDYWCDEIIVEAIGSSLGNRRKLDSLTKLKRIILPVPFEWSMSEELRLKLDQISADSGIGLASEDEETSFADVFSISKGEK